VAASGGTNLAASGGRIELGSVAGTGLVSLTPIEKGWSLGYEGIQNFKNIQLSEQAFVDASDSVQMSQPTFGNTSDKGGGDVQLQGRHVTLTDGSEIVTGSDGAKPGGTLSVNATESVELSGTAPNNSNFFSSLSTQTTGVGAGGNLTINTGKLIVQDGAQVSASTLGAGQGGALVVNASDSVVLSRTAPNGNSSGLSAQTEGSGNAGDLTINTGKLIVQDGAQVSASTSGAGQGGTLVVNASNSVQLSGTETVADGRLSPSGVFAQTLNIDTGAAGNLTINTGKLIVQDGAQLAVSTRSQGQGGNLKVTASDSVELSGTAPKNELSSGLFARTLSTGAAGNLTIATRKLIVQDGAQVTVSSVGSGSGSAGNLEIAARSINLDNQGKLIAETGSAQGGNIKLYDLDLLLMRHGSQISATAGTANAYGDGGNIDINTKFLVAVPSEDSNITANAYTGKGGRIQIAASAIFGIQPQNRNTPQSDITASSQLGINGTVQINALDINPSLGLVALPAEPVDVTGLIAQRCAGSGGNVGRGESKFIITGRGGLPPNPSDPLNSDALWIDLDSTTQLQENRSISEEVTQVTKSTTEPLVEATGWVTNDKGEVVLTASAPTATPYSLRLTPVKCHVP